MAKIQIYLSKADREMKIEDCDFSRRVTNCLRRRGMETVGDIFASGVDLTKIRGFGKTSYDELSDWFVARQIEKYGIKEVARRVIDDEG